MFFKVEYNTVIFLALHYTARFLPIYIHGECRQQGMYAKRTFKDCTVMNNASENTLNWLHDIFHAIHPKHDSHGSPLTSPMCLIYPVHFLFQFCI